MNYLRWEVIGRNTSQNWGAQDVDAPKVRITSMNAISRPGRVANTHYYGGLPEVNVVEVMSCGKTTDEVIARLFERLPAYGCKRHAWDLYSE